MTRQIDALNAELASLRQDLEDLRLEFPDALLEGDIATERVIYAAKGRSLRSTRR